MTSTRFAVLLTLLIAFTGHQRVQSHPPLSPRFGVVEPQDDSAQADALGVGWGRVRFHWAMDQPDGPDQWVEAEITSEQLAQEQASGRETIGLLIGIPDWAREANGLPKGLYLAPNDPGNLWASFVREAVMHLSDRRRCTHKR